ncbi:hypothetical protein [Methylorubrum extorquens]|uniref:hypothetical protein n=1 Tax=Methylorubrum extorquens TaxID=408 RepID=UPI001AEEA5B4|nr:hypothetical protein [Methylorubrum extorquens]
MLSEARLPHPECDKLGFHMAFKDDTKTEVDQYARNHLNDEGWHISYFGFISDAGLARRLGEEFISARYIYKILEGLEAKDWLQRAQIRNQVISYASIYEAALHHILFVNLASDPKVVALTEFKTRKPISIPASKLAVLKAQLEHDGKNIIPTFDAVGKTEETKVRFDKKAECAHELGIIEDWLKDELIEFYEARNAIHIHAEIRKSLNYELDLSKRAYYRMQPFREQIVKWQEAKATQISAI